jgi:WXG100 family type VII secretion target
VRVGQSVEVVVSELYSAAARLDDAAQRLRDGLSSVDTETTQLLGAEWKGGAASAYAPAWEQWHGGAEQVIEGLQRMSELLTIAGREYAKTDEAGADAVGSTVQGAGGSGAPSGAGGAGGQGAAGGGNQAAQSAGGPQQAMSAAPQLGQAAAQPLTQAGQAGQGAAGLVQQAMQLATTLAQLAAEPDEDEQDDESERPQDDPGEPEAGAARGERPSQSAPIEVLSRDEPTQAVERPGE